MKISRTKITASSVDKRLSFTSTKYKGYRISLDHKNNCYNIYDKHGELEDSGFTSQLAAKDAVDKLVEASEVKSSKKVTASMMYEDMDGSMAGEVGEYLSLEDLVDMYDDLKDYDPIVEQYDSFESWLRDTVNNGYLREVYSSKKITSEEDVEYLDNKDTLREFIDELVEHGVDIYDDQDILQELGANYGYDRDDQFAILEDIREYVGQGINSAEETDDELETTEQEFTSRDTSINSSKLPAI